MRSIRSRMRYGSFVARLSVWAEKELNFYRVHLMAFTLIPLITAAVFYASNGRTKISFLDSLFMCTSAMTSSGLNTVNLSTTTVWQQVILAFLMFIGNSTSISFVVLLIRRSYFKSRCEDAVRMARQQRRERDLVRPKLQKTTTGASVFGRIKTRAQTVFGWEPTPIINEAREDGLGAGTGGEKKVVQGETTITSVKEVSASSENDASGGDGNNHGNGLADVRLSNGNGHPNGHGLGHANGNGHPNLPEPPAAMAGTATTSSPARAVLPELTESPAHEFPPDHASPHVPSAIAPTGSTKFRPKSLALGHESDRNVKRSKGQAGIIRVGDREILETKGPGVIGHEKEKDNKEEEQERPHDIPLATSSPTELPDAQFATAALSPNHATFATSPNEIDEFTSNSPISPTRENDAHASAHRRGTHSSAPHASHKKTLPENNHTLHAPHTAPRRQRTKFVEPVHSPHAHAHFSHIGHPQITDPYHMHQLSRTYTGQGGLPSPFEIAGRWVTGHVPAVKRFLGEHEMEVVKETEGRGVYPRTDSNRGHGGDATSSDIDEVSLEEHDLERMGGDEYNALVVLSWIVAGHYLLHHAIAFVILAPYSAKIPVVRDVIQAQNESSGRTLNTTWFALFTVISAYANAGLTVVDTSLTQMSGAYVLIFAIMWLILVGATAFPLSLRFFVWVGTKIFRRGSTHKGLKFLLKHPRRCFMYLFPSHQSWFLLFTLVVIFFVNWIAYLTFNIGMPGIESIPTGPRVVGGLLQAAGQRAGGFTTINLQAIAPALQVIYIATMFVQVYPVAMAVRTSNVYEDSGVVIYEPEEDEDEPTTLPAGRGAGFKAYVGWHLKHQLAQDLFWLIAALTALCAFERGRILDENTSYFNIFSLFFEIVSSFANVGFSLGVATQPFSLSGEFHTIPKLIIIGLMIRGRHRGLPMAIDRAVQLPTEYKTTSNVASTSVASSRRSTPTPRARRPTVGTYSRTTMRQRQRMQDPTLSSDEDD